MKPMKFFVTWLLVLFLLTYSQQAVFGQVPENHEFFLNAHKSLSPVKRFQGDRVAVFKTYLTFHPISVSNDTVNLFVSSIFTNAEGKQTVESGRVIRIPQQLLPDEPLQLIVLPLVMYLNSSKAFRADFDFAEKFSRKELAIWEACGYTVADPMKISTSMQYR